MNHGGIGLKLTLRQRINGSICGRIKRVKRIWMSEEVQETMMTKTQEEDFIQRSEQVKKNKRGGSLDNVIEPRHFQGSISTSEHTQREGAYERKLAEYKDKGVEIDPNDVYLEVVGRRKRGLIPALGTTGNLLYEKSSSRLDNPFTYRPLILSQLSERVEQQANEIESQ
ncbi:UDP-N-acetylglucosamine--peptide N-acetylglucosaminyltransferase [Bienertia sinuspersici]